MQMALTPMHEVLIFGQAIDDALRSIAPDDWLMAIEIAHAHGYETESERQEMVGWLGANRGPLPTASFVKPR